MDIKKRVEKPRFKLKRRKLIVFNKNYSKVKGILFESRKTASYSLIKPILLKLYKKDAL